MTQTLDPAALRPGDVLLMRGKSEISDLVAWFGDSIYSHAAILVDGGELVEAAPPVSRIRSLRGRLEEGRYYFHVDAWRPARRDGQPLTGPDREAIARAARALVETPYPIDAFVQMGLFASLRHRIPADRRLIRLLRSILEHVLEEDPDQVTCSELVYRALASASAHTAADLEPVVTAAAILDPPFPPVDVLKLWEEWRKIRPRSLDDALVPASGTVEDPTAGPDDPEAELADLAGTYERVRAARGLAPFAGPLAMARPNPRNVLPVDLESSPSIRFLGRLPLSL